MSIEAMRQALEALEEINKLSIGESAICLPGEIDAAMDTLRQAIEQAEQQEETVMAEYKFQTYAAYKKDGEMKIGVVPEPEQEPVAWYDPEVMNEDRGISWTQGQFHTAPLYTAPPPRQPLTEEQISDLWDGHTVPVFGKTGINPIVFARAIEAAHGITGEIK